MTEPTWRERMESHARACRGEDGTRLSPVDLTGADLRGADLRRADLRGADLRRADLRRADLTGADLRGADLRRADLMGANIPQLVYIGPVGSRHDVLMLHIPDMVYRAGCWTGTRDELLAKLDEVYPSGQHRSDYLTAIAALEGMAAARCRRPPNDRPPAWWRY